MLGLGVLAGGLTVVGLPLAGPAHRPGLATTGLAVVAALFVVGLLHVPGVASGPVARLRHALDGLTIGLCLALAGWLLVPGIGGDRPYGYVAAMVAVTGASVTAATAARVARQRPAIIRCIAGAALPVAGLVLLVTGVGTAAPGWQLLAAAGLVVAGPPLIWAGVRRVELAIPAERSGSLDEAFGGYPMLALPVGATVVAAAYHLGTVGLPDRTAVQLGIAVGSVLALRELVAADDVRRRTRRLVGQEARLRALVAGASDATLVLDEDLRVRWQSPAAHQLGLANQVGRRFPQLVHPDDAAEVTDRLRAIVASAPGRTGAPVLLAARLRGGDGGWRETESTISDLRRTPEVGALVAQVRDVGQRRDLERALLRLTRSDPLTGLPNRRELLGAITARQGASRWPGALLVIDLPGIVAAADRHGRAAGDAVLVEAARRLCAQAGRDDLVGRLGESQFAVVTPEGPIEAYALAVRLLAAVIGTYRPAGEPVLLRASVGLAALTLGADADEVVRRGSLALRQADRLGPDRIEWYDEGLADRAVRQQDLVRHLPGAAGRGELDLVYQPVVELDRGRPVGVAALLRWRHPMLGTVLPEELLPVADELGTGEEIGDWTLHTACRQAAGWRREGHDLWLSLSVSARQLISTELVPEVAAALSVQLTPPERLTIAVRDAEVGADLPGVAAQLSKLRALGVRTALAGFGAGHRDLSRLRRLPLDVVTLAVSPAASARPRVEAVVDLAARLGLTVVATELEAESQRELVRGAGCRYGQGHLVSPPVPPEHLEAYLDEAYLDVRRPFCPTRGG